MKYIIENYGKFLLEGAVVTAILLFLFSNIQDSEGNKGIFRVIGAKLPIETNDYGAYTDYDTYASESTKLPPDVVFENSGMLYAEEDMLIQTFIKTSDYTGGQPELRVYKITDMLGNDVTSCYNSDTGNVRFPDDGIYEFELAVKDSTCKKYTCTILVPVNSRG